MNIVEIKTSLVFGSMIFFLVMALATQDAVNSQLFASFGIIAGASASHHISKQNKSSNSKSKKYLMYYN